MAVSVLAAVLDLAARLSPACRSRVCQHHHGRFLLASSTKRAGNQPEASTLTKPVERDRLDCAARHRRTPDSRSGCSGGPRRESRLSESLWKPFARTASGIDDCRYDL